jgi:hypothetical protein
MTNIEVGSIWKRRVEFHDEFDVVRVVGRVFMGEGQESEYTITPANEFGEIVQTAAEGILEHCELVQPGAEADWTTDAP